MDNNEQNKLIDSLLVWYWANKDKINSNKKFWIQDKVGRELASILKECNRWKNAPRGKHDKSFPEKKELTGVNDECPDF